MVSQSCLLHGDAYELINNIPDHSIDLILTDPPYNLSKYSTGDLRFGWRSTINNAIAEWDSREFDPKDWADSFKRVIKPQGNIFIFTSYNQIGRWHEVFDPLFDTFQFMVWHKTNPTPKIYKNGFLNSCELIVCLWNKGHYWNFLSQKAMHNFIETPICMGNERLKAPKHPTQKPVKVLEHIINVACPQGGVVLDPFMGVGSTGVACENLGRSFVGIELEANYYQASHTRLKNAATDLFLNT